MTLQLPRPGMPQYGLELTVARTPSQPCARQRRVGDEAGRIACPPRRQDNGNAAVGDPLSHVYHFLHRKAVPVPQVESGAFAAVEQVSKRQQVRVAEIAHVDIIAYAGPIGRIVIVPEHLDVPGCPVSWPDWRRRGDKRGSGD